MTHNTPLRAPSTVPRRTVLAALVSAGTAAAATGLVHWGGLDAPEQARFQFSRGTTFAEGEEARLRGFLARAVSEDRLAVVITGHSGSTGEAAANQALSARRAQIAAQTALDLGIPEARITAAGVGGAAPLPKQDGQSEREFQSTLSRVDVTLRVLR